MAEQQQFDFERGWQRSLLNNVRFPATGTVAPGYLMAVLNAIYSLGYTTGVCWASGETILRKMGRIPAEVDLLPAEERQKKIANFLKQLRRAVAVLANSHCVLTCDAKKNPAGVVTNHHQIVWHELRRFDSRKANTGHGQLAQENGNATEGTWCPDRRDMVSRPKGHGVPTEGTWCPPSIKEPNPSASIKPMGGSVGFVNASDSGERRARANEVANRLARLLSLRRDKQEDLQLVAKVAFLAADGAVSEADLENVCEGVSRAKSTGKLGNPVAYFFTRLDNRLGGHGALRFLLSKV